METGEGENVNNFSGIKEKGEPNLEIFNKFLSGRSQNDQNSTKPMSSFLRYM